MKPLFIYNDNVTSRSWPERKGIVKHNFSLLTYVIELLHSAYKLVGKNDQNLNLFVCYALCGSSITYVKLIKYIYPPSPPPPPPLSLTPSLCNYLVISMKCVSLNPLFLYVTKLLT